MITELYWTQTSRTDCSQPHKCPHKQAEQTVHNPTSVHTNKQSRLFTTPQVSTQTSRAGSSQPHKCPHKQAEQTVHNPTSVNTNSGKIQCRTVLYFFSFLKFSLSLSPSLSLFLSLSSVQNHHLSPLPVIRKIPQLASTPCNIF
ncbi:hypothetical protein BsWGS_15242 [Bradybaena similaris]